MREKSQSADETPTAIGRYLISGTLGSGAMGTVYRAFDPLIKRTLAIKTVRLDIPRQSPQHRVFIERFYQEARISGTLSHPNIVTLYDIGDEGGVPFLAMEYVDGRTVADLLEDGVRFKPEKVLALVSQVASAVDYAHSRGIIHRDIKPSNLIVYEDDKVKVTDFGIAKVVSTEITQAGVLLGTPSYMSPEQAMGEKLDGRSDIFSLGVCAFEMLSGDQPFPGGNVTSILYKLVHVDPIEPANLEMNGLVPQKWREVFSKVLAKKPENRYQTATAFVEDLEYCMGSWFTGLGETTVAIGKAQAPEATVTVRGVPGPEEVPTQALSQPPVGEAVTVAVATPPASSPGPDDSDTLVLAPALAPASRRARHPIPPQPSHAVDRRVPAPTAAMGPPSEAVVTQRFPTTSPTIPAPSTARRARPPARSGLRVGWLVGGALGVCLAVAVVVAWALWQRAQAAAPAPEAAPSALANLPPPSSLPPPAVATGSLRVVSEPPGARVLVNGAARGQTPLTLADLPLGAYAVRLDLRGYDSQTRGVSLTRDAPTLQVRVSLVPTAPATGAADVVSTPAGAAVSVDGRPAGTTPIAGLKLAPGVHRLEVALDEHETWSGTVEVVAGRRERVEAQLHPLPKPAAPTPAPIDANRVYANTLGEVDVLARKVSGNSPSYPSDRAPRLKSGERVSVVVSFLITEAGDVQDVTVQESGGRIVDDVVLSAIRSWKYQPAAKGGTRVKVRVLFKQTFLGG